MFKKRQLPEMPKNPTERNKMIWKALYNEIPHRFELQDMKLNFTLVLVALILAAIAAKLFGF